MSLELPPAERSAKVVVELLDAVVAYGSKVVLQDVNLALRRGQRLALLGRNGNGKSSLLKVLAGLLAPAQGRRLTGGRVTMGVFGQHALDDLHPDHDVLSELLSVSGDLALSRVRGILGAFLFRGDDVFKKVRVLSGGERSRLVLAKLLVGRPNTLLLDEPTNHLDIASRKVLERALKEFRGTLVLVTHDRHLINAVADSVAYVAAGRVEVLPGNYDDFQRLWRRRVAASDACPAPAQDETEAGKASRSEQAARRRAQAEARNARYRLLKPLRDKLAGVESRVDEATVELERLEGEMVALAGGEDPARLQELSRAAAAARQRLEALTAQWEQVALELEKREQEAS